MDQGINLLNITIAFAAGILSFLSPCVLPLFPSYLSFVTGMSVADLQADLTAAARRRVMLHAISFVVGFSLVFVSLGASFSLAGQVLLDFRDPIRRVGGVLIIIFGLHMMGVFRLAFLDNEKRAQTQRKGAHARQSACAPGAHVTSLPMGIT